MATLVGVVMTIGTNSTIEVGW